MTDGNDGWELSPRERSDVRRRLLKIVRSQKTADRDAVAACRVLIAADRAARDDAESDADREAGREEFRRLLARLAPPQRLPEPTQEATRVE